MICELTGIGEHTVSCPHGHDLQVLSSELGGHGELLPADPFLTLTVLCDHGRMMGHL